MTDRITDTRTHKENIDKLSVQDGPFDAWGPNSTYQNHLKYGSTTRLLQSEKHYMNGFWINIKKPTNTTRLAPATKLL